MIRPDDTENDQWRDDIAGAETLVRECGQGLPEVVKRVVEWAVKQAEKTLPQSDLPQSDLPQSDLPPIDPHWAAHRVGSPSRIETDPELNAFVRARIDRMTFAQIEADVAAHFPPGQRASMSGLHRWFHRQKQRGTL